MKKLLITMLTIFTLNNLNAVKYFCVAANEKGVLQYKDAVLLDTTLTGIDRQKACIDELHKKTHTHQQGQLAGKDYYSGSYAIYGPLKTATGKGEKLEYVAKNKVTRLDDPHQF